MSTEKLARIVVPTLIAVAGLAVAFLASSGAAMNTGEARAVESAPAPTPYSADHARVQASPGEAGAPAPTF